jgi:hypothetical protein
MAFGAGLLAAGKAALPYLETALPFLSSLGVGGGGGGGGLFGGGGQQGFDYQNLDLEKIREFLKPSQELITEQLGLSRQLMDPQSAINETMKNLMRQRATETGAQTGTQALKIAAMRNVSPGQALMSQRFAQNQATGGVNQLWQQAMQGRFGQGLGLMGNMSQMQQGQDENLANAYIGDISGQNMANAMMYNPEQQQSGGLLGSIMPMMGTGQLQDIWSGGKDIFQSFMQGGGYGSYGGGGTGTGGGVGGGGGI